MSRDRNGKSVEDGSSLFMNALNLHDVFMNASLCYSYMHKYPVREGVEEFMVSNRGRFERMWIAFLFVLIEAWQSKFMSTTRNYLASFVPDDVAKVKDIIQKAKRDGSLTRMKKVRDYMSHRDRREYHDEGRLAVAGQLLYNETIHHTFSEMFLNYFALIKSKNKTIVKNRKTNK